MRRQEVISTVYLSADIDWSCALWYRSVTNTWRQLSQLCTASSSSSSPSSGLFLQSIASPSSVLSSSLQLGSEKRNQDCKHGDLKGSFQVTFNLATQNRNTFSLEAAKGGLYCRFYFKSIQKWVFPKICQFLMAGASLLQYAALFPTPLSNNLPPLG